MGHKIWAVFILNAKEVIMNMSMLTSILLPVVMSLMFMRMDRGLEDFMPLVIIYVTVGITFASVTGGVLMGMLAEENEQGTLRHMIIDKQSMAANIIGKGLLLFILTFVVLNICILLLDAAGMMSFIDIIALAFLWIFFFFASAAFGVISKTVASSSLYMVIMLFLFAMTPYIELLISEEGNIFRRIAEITPLYQAIFIQEGILVQPFLILSGWAMVSLIFFLIIFNRKAKLL
jgi:ABC-2 type transport system permease protein